MPVDYGQRLENLRNRRLGLTEPLQKSMFRADSATTDSRTLKEEAYQRRAQGRATRYALGAMQAVDPEYTRNTYEEGDRVKNQLTEALRGDILIDFRYQGSVPLDIHIRGVSDVDMLILRDDFITYDRDGPAAQAGRYQSPMSDTPLARMMQLRARCESILVQAYPAANVDVSGAKSITLSGGSLRRKVDVVPSHWHDTPDYQASNEEFRRGVKVLVKGKNHTTHNLPFVHMRQIEIKDLMTDGGTKKAIRVLKNLKNDSDTVELITLSSYDIASLVWHFPDESLRLKSSMDLTLLANVKMHIDWCVNNRSQVVDLPTPDGTRKIFDNDSKFLGLRLLALELEQLVEDVAGEWKENQLLVTQTPDQLLRKAFVSS